MIEGNNNEIFIDNKIEKISLNKFKGILNLESNCFINIVFQLLFNRLNYLYKNNCLYF